MGGAEEFRIFIPHARGVLVSRENRFIVFVQIPRGIVRAHCPNPGRLIELMNPGRKVILEKARGKGRKTDWTLVAAEYRGQMVSLYSARANKLVEKLVIPRLFPGAREVRGEYPWNRSRFDWHFFCEDREIFLEVKACTLVEEGCAMFPDAPSLRASRHLHELSQLSDPDVKREAHVVFVIMNPHARHFIPNLHTDPEFAITLNRVSPRVCCHGVSVFCDSQGYASISSLNVPVISDCVQALFHDRGMYIILIQINDSPEKRNITAYTTLQKCSGCSCRWTTLRFLCLAYAKISSFFRKVINAVGPEAEQGMGFQPGWYVYTASAMKDLAARVRHHLAGTKKNHSRVDYLISTAEKTTGFPIYGMDNMENEMAAALALMADLQTGEWGSSEGTLDSHLFYFSENPMENRLFLDLLFHYRHTRCFRDSHP